MLAIAKKACGVTTTAYDDIFNMLIAAAKAELARVGVAADKANDITDPLIKMAISTYCKAYFDEESTFSEDMKRSFADQRAALKDTTAYNGGDA